MKYKVGDKVRVIKEITGHHYTLGSIVTIRAINETNYCITEEVDGCNWTVSDDEVELVDTEPINKQSIPEHYKTDSIDVIDFCKIYNLNFNLGNIVKYVCRDKGSDVEDLEKVIDYAQREIKHLKSLGK